MARPTAVALSELRHQAADCRRCDLFERATQTVVGEGPSRARMMLGDQPGDATAAKALMDLQVRVTRDRGSFVSVGGIGPVMPTVHPSSVLRADRAHRSGAFDALVADVASAADRVASQVG